MGDREAAQTLWIAVRHGLARLSRGLAAVDLADDAVFQAPWRDAKQTVDAERRIAEARKARMRDGR